MNKVENPTYCIIIVIKIWRSSVELQHLYIEQPLLLSVSHQTSIFIHILIGTTRNWRALLPSIATGIIPLALLLLLEMLVVVPVHVHVVLESHSWWWWKIIWMVNLQAVALIKWALWSIIKANPTSVRLGLYIYQLFGNYI